jgi:hypothetical protein
VAPGVNTLNVGYGPPKLNTSETSRLVTIRCTIQDFGIPREKRDPDKVIDLTLRIVKRPTIDLGVTSINLEHHCRPEQSVGTVSRIPLNSPPLAKTVTFPTPASGS